ncbi:MAG: bifunctional adenosylcobinamide kinase/adenosylcobinamide-phosphate guanylyltransferase [Thermoleophilia bacterium]|nr:bifunctional adenosylcobinamide kinase/adenosylcobinamide-phosphate guanylyltransferase [Thermoleophilia bacterium]
MIFVTGGARSGKSGLAEKLARERAIVAGSSVASSADAAATDAAVIYIATAEAKDGEMRERIAEHRERRPAGWRTVEAPENLSEAVEEALAEGGIVLVDCLTVYISNLLMNNGIASGERVKRAVDREMDELVEVCRSGDSRVILVSNEVGMGIVPDNMLARTFRDVAGRANQKLAAAADEVYLCVSGIPMKVK